jgi:hypothetical protein
MFVSNYLHGFEFLSIEFACRWENFVAANGVTEVRQRFRAAQIRHILENKKIEIFLEEN